MVLEPEGWALACILKSVAEEVVIKPECVRMCFCPTSEDTHSPSHANTQVAFNSRSPVPTTLLSVFDFIVFFQIASLSAFQQATSQWWWCFCPLSWCFWWRPLLLGFLIWVSYTYARQLQCVVFLKPTSLLSIPTIWRLATMCDTGKSRLMPLETLDANPIGVEELACHI